MTLIALTTQNRRFISNHAGRCRRFTLARLIQNELQLPLEQVELEIENTLRQSVTYLPEPLRKIDVLITAGIGEQLTQRLLSQNVQVYVTNIQDPIEAIHAWTEGRNPGTKLRIVALPQQLKPDTK